jgi:hypothetical protein
LNHCDNLTDVSALCNVFNLTMNNLL